MRQLLLAGHGCLNKLPNVNIGEGGLTNSITVRGVGSGNNSGFEQSVGTFVDGLFRPRSQSASALNIVSRKAGDEFDYNLYGLYGTDSEYKLEGGVTIPISDALSVRLAGRYSGWDSYIENNNPGVNDDTKNTQVRLAFRF
jgi:hypothetical protein